MVLVPMLLFYYLRNSLETQRENSSLGSHLIIRLSVNLSLYFEITSYQLRLYLFRISIKFYMVALVSL